MIQNHKYWAALPILVGIFIFLLSPAISNLLSNFNIFEIREQFVYLSGICAISLMVFAMILSLRLSFINKIIGGLDKVYKVHKWIGIYALIFVLLHWSAENIPHWLIDLGIIPHPGELGDEQQFSATEIIFFEIGVLIGEYTFYFFIILIAISLSKKIPYHLFRFFHKSFPIIFLLLAYHAGTALIKEHWFNSFAGYLSLFLLSLGSLSAFLSLFQLIGRSKQKIGFIKSFDLHSSGILLLTISSEKKLFETKAGQYFFLQFSHNKEPHPFSLISHQNNCYSFAIKRLGDFTNDLIHHLKIGNKIRVEGPYGEFLFSEDKNSAQIWIAGGIGITPFLARLLELQKSNEKLANTHFWFCTRGNLEIHFPENIETLCAQCGITLYHIDSEKNYLTIKEIERILPNYLQIEIWFCGKEKFANGLLNELNKNQYNLRKFHYDNFEMR